jgi:serine/threonine protein kinase
VASYELLERIGAGGMAEIFRGRATAIGGFEKPVAIKKILPHLAQEPRFVRMLITEAKLLASLRHRNVVQIFDVGLSDQGEYFLVMEYVEGIDLGVVYDKLVFNDRSDPSGQRLSVDLVLYIGSEICDALDHVHRAVDAEHQPLALIHRDVSPSNVMLSYAGEVKLTDFGISKRAEQASVVTSLKGKFAYMSPEQARAQPTLDATTDIYSLGIILYELLLARRLFSHRVDLDALTLVREGRVPRPTDVDPNFGRELERMLLKALAVSPRERFQSAAELGAALRDFRYSAATAAGDPAKEIGNLLQQVRPRRPLFERVLDSGSFVRIETAAGFTGPGDFADPGETSGMTTRVRPGPDDTEHDTDVGDDPASDDYADATTVDDRGDVLPSVVHGPPSGELARPAPQDAAATIPERRRTGLENRLLLLDRIARASAAPMPLPIPAPPSPASLPQPRRPPASAHAVPRRILFLILASLIAVMAIVALVIARFG